MAKDGRTGKTADAPAPGQDPLSGPLNGVSQHRPPAPVIVREVEAKFDVGDGFTLPQLAGVAGIAALGDAREHHLDATYYDTADLRLLRNGVTLRRRTGGSDAGWHLKLPAGGSGSGVGTVRDEVRLPAGRAAGRAAAAVPKALAERVFVITRGEPLAPVVRLQTRRTEHPALAADGRTLAEIAHDIVSASSPSRDGSSTTLSAWSEVEVELVGGRRAVLSAVGQALRKAGARPSSAPSKLARALADQLAQIEQAEQIEQAQQIEQAPAPRVDGLRRSTAGGVLMRHLAEHVGRLKAYDPLVRADEPDAVHQMRVATRRLRSALATFRPLFDREVTDPLREELAWLAGVLGAARDAEVIRDHLQQLVAAEPADLVLGPVQARIGTSLGATYRAAHDAVLVELRGARYLALLQALDRLLAQPPLTEAAVGPADRVLLPLAARSWRKMRRLHEVAESLEDVSLEDVALEDASAGAAEADRRDLALHDLRKEAKRARYAGEALVPRYGSPAKRWAGRMAAIQETLGAHQDTVVIREQLLRLAEAAHQEGENTFTYGRLHALEQARAEATVRDYRPDWDRAAEPALHRWLRQ